MLDGMLLKTRQRRLTVCCSPCLAVTFKPGISFSAVSCIQPVYKTVSACIHRHTVGTLASAAYNFQCRCQHSYYPYTVIVHTPTVLPAWLPLSIIFQAHFRASCWSSNTIFIIHFDHMLFSKFCPHSTRYTVLGVHNVSG